MQFLFSATIVAISIFTLYPLIAAHHHPTTVRRRPLPNLFNRCFSSCWSFCIFIMELDFIESWQTPTLLLTWNESYQPILCLLISWMFECMLLYLINWDCFFFIELNPWDWKINHVNQVAEKETNGNQHVSSIYLGGVLD